MAPTHQRSVPLRHQRSVPFQSVSLFVLAALAISCVKSAPCVKYKGHRGGVTARCCLRDYACLIFDYVFGNRVVDISAVQWEYYQNISMLDCVTQCSQSTA